METTRALAGIVVLAAVVVCATGCDQSSPKPATTAAAAETPPEHVFVVRGKIADMPRPDKPGSSLQIQHEAIPDFVGQKGPAPMPSMTMPFPVGKAVSLDGLALGDVVEFTFEVRWNSTPHAQVTKIGKLPADTKLNFELPKK